MNVKPEDLEKFFDELRKALSDDRIIEISKTEVDKDASRGHMWSILNPSIPEMPQTVEFTFKVKIPAAIRVAIKETEESVVSVKALVNELSCECPFVDSDLEELVNTIITDVLTLMFMLKKL